MMSQEKLLGDQINREAGYRLNSRVITFDVNTLLPQVNHKQNLTCATFLDY